MARIKRIVYCIGLSLAIFRTVKVASIGTRPGVGVTVVRVRTVLVNQAFCKINKVWI